jgi:hypothetical protein
METPTYSTYARWGFTDGRARCSLFISAWTRIGAVYAVAWAFGHLFFEKEAS